MTTTNNPGATVPTESTPSSITSTSGQSSPNSNQQNMVTISNVAEIFHAAGYAFKKLSELIQTMDPDAAINESGGHGNQQNNGNNNYIENGYQTHWDHTDVELFSSIVNHFTEDLNQLSMNLKNKMANRLREEHFDAKMKTLSQQEQELIQQQTIINKSDEPSS